MLIPTDKDNAMFLMISGALAAAEVAFHDTLELSNGFRSWAKEQKTIEAHKFTASCISVSNLSNKPSSVTRNSDLPSLGSMNPCPLILSRYLSLELSNGPSMAQLDLTS
ncbi:hypothetical protein F2Q68_00005554 [Brassica cretica]|uniref:Uncharacterized protein n=1 Tax=Brassica cretica TaxID=69181 RepID=A0A8S9JN22_BRACR|nr:hypothetical protein F2Q68_00005554 [Brassica cretica]